MLGEATLQELKPSTWAVSAGNGVTLNNVDSDLGTARFTAADENSSASLILTDRNGRAFTLQVAVIQPTGAYQEKAAEGKYQAGMCSAFMANYTYLLPKDVSFGKVLVNEGVCYAVGTGSQQSRTGEGHPGWLPMSVSNGDIAKGCLVEGPNASGPYGTVHEYDMVAAWGPLHIGPGVLDWDIPLEYSVGQVRFREFTRLLQRTDFKGNQSVTLSKGGVSTTQTGP